MKNCLTFLFYFFSIVYLYCQIKVIDVKNPGSLSKLLGSEINSITELKINGKINSVDYTTLKSMKKLSVLDLSNSGANDGILPANIFEYNTILKNIILPSSLTTISNYAFQDAYNVSIDASKCTLLKNIGEHAFSQVKGKIILPDQLENLPYKSFSSFNGTIVLPKNLKTIGKEAFIHSKINTLDLTQCPLLKTIGQYVFYEVKGKIILPDQLEILPKSSFDGFMGTVVLPKNLKSIGEYAFFNSRINTLNLTQCPLLETIADNAFAYASILNLDLSKATKLKNIGKKAFQFVEGKIILPDQLESLPELSFAYSDGTVILPKNLKTIGKEAFYYSQINTLDLTQCPLLEAIADGAFAYANILNLDLSKATKLNNISKYAFSGVEGKIILPEQLESLPKLSFAGFNGTVVLPKNLKNIGKKAFYNSQIIEINLPGSLHSIADKAFYNAKYLSTISCNAATPPLLGENVFYGVNKNTCSLKVPDASHKLYVKAKQWKDF